MRTAMTRGWRGWAVALGATLTIPAGLTAQSTAAPAPQPQVIDASLVGKDSFDRYCAPCHGVTGHGDGTVAASLHGQPAELTTLAQRDGGAFDREAVRRVIDGTGRVLPAHGTSEMPVWGPLFRMFEAKTRTDVRIDNLVTYIESLQAPSTGPQDLGSQLFRAHCASCHGVDARGSGAQGDRLKHVPPDLTQFTRLNGGIFPRERLRRIVDGRDVSSHVNREMPVWGDVFRTTGGNSPESVKARIDAILRYLEGIQERGA